MDPQTPASEFDRSAARRWRVAQVWAVVLAFPSLFLGFFMDDWFHLVRLETSTGWFPDLFGFIRDGGGPQGPWWTSPDLAIAFWRPLSAATARLDYAWFGESAAGFHAHSMLWFFAMLAAAAWVFRGVLPEFLASSAFLLFAVDDVHFLPVAWIANRNALITGAFVFIALGAYLRAHRAAAWHAVGVPAFVAALAGGEAGVELLAYIVAYELFQADGAVRRVLRAAPYLAVGVAYLVLRSIADLGVRGSSSYLDPVRDPVAWVEHAPVRAVAMAGGVLLGSPLDLWLLQPASRPFLVGMGGFALLFVVIAGRVAAAALDPEPRRTVAWLGLGSVLSVIPALSAFPATRLAVIPGLGAAAVVAVVWRHWRTTRGTESDPGRRFRIAAAWLSWMALSAPLSWAAHYAVIGWLGATSERVARAADLGGPEVTSVVIVNPPEPAVALYLPAIRWIRDDEAPRSFTLLTVRPTFAWARVGDELHIAPTDGGALLDEEFERLFLGPTPWVEGQVVRRGAWTATVDAADARGPLRVRLAHDRSLDDPSLRWLAWDGAALRPVRPGEVVPGFLDDIAAAEAIPVP